MDRAKILLIDDEKKVLDSLKSSLELEDYEVITANDGEEGLVCIKASKPDLIVCDWRMPKKDGFEVLKEIKKDKEFNRIPFIMLTAVDGLDKMTMAYHDEVDFYITKPVDLFALFKSIRLLLNLAKSRIN